MMYLGLGYPVNETFIACEGCLVFQCHSRPCDDRDGSKFKLWWQLREVEGECCQDRRGRVLPPNKVDNILFT